MIAPSISPQSSARPFAAQSALFALTPAQIITLWEEGTTRHPIDRALLLLTIALPDQSPENLPDLPLSQRNSTLMQLYIQHVSDTFFAWVNCEDCGERMEFELDSTQLPAATENLTPLVEAAGYQWYRPTSRHLASIANIDDPQTAAVELMQRCAANPNDLPTEITQLEELLLTVEPVMESEDPWAELSVTLRCPACEHPQSASLDVPDLLWQQFSHIAHGLLDDVDTLARTYGWSEETILSLSDYRRAAYIARAQL